MYDRSKIKEITFAECDVIELYDDIAAEFLLKICNLSSEDCMISDESRLSDFSTCCIPDEVNTDGMSMQELHEFGKELMVTQVRDEYELSVHPHDYLIQVFELIRQDRLKILH